MTTDNKSWHKAGNLQLALRKLSEARQRTLTVTQILDGEIKELIYWGRYSSSYASAQSYLRKALEELMEFDEIWEKYNEN